LCREPSYILADQCHPYLSGKCILCIGRALRDHSWGY
jgi:hypothetical protein